MSDDLNAAVAVLQRKLDEQLQSAAETKKTINMLLKSMGKPAQYVDVGESSGIIRADQFYGKQFATAAAEYLELRKQACQPDEILRGMIEGGFDFDVLGWRESDRLRSLSISLAKNNTKFHRLKNGSFGLRSWYDEDFLKKAAAKRSPINPANFVDEEEEEQLTQPLNGSGAYVPKIGDYVQWESKGVLQFPEPKRIISISEDGAVAFVEGGTGAPVGELTLQSAPPVTKKRGRPPKVRAAADQVSKGETA